MDDFFDDVGEQNSEIDSKVRRFYDKLSDLPSSWIQLQDVFYRNTMMGELEIGKQKEFKDWPQLNYFHFTHARNGGPIGLLTKQHVLLVGQKTPKNIVFLFDAFGKMYQNFHLEKKIEGLTPGTKWVLFTFNSEEDLVLMSADGRLYILDIVLGEVKEKVHFTDFSRTMQESSYTIADAKLDQVHNLLVFRTKSSEFYYVPNVVTGSVSFVKPLPFFSVPRLELEEADRDINIEFLIIPKQDSKSKQIELLVTDPIEGIHLIKENGSKYLKDMSEFLEEDDDVAEPFGHVKYLALNAKKDLLAMYCEPENEGRIIVMKSDLSMEFNRQDTYQVGASQLAWCGNDCCVLSVFDKLVIIGPMEHDFIDLHARAEGIYCQTELDGLRVITAEHTYFLERVQNSLKDTFSLASIEPSAKLHNAQKSRDFNNPRADEIIRELVNRLNEGIETLMHAAMYESKDIDVLKHLLSTASFAKKFSDPTELDPNQYVNLVKMSIVLTKLRHSKLFARAITYTQLQKFKPKNMVKVLLKYRDYGLAITMIEHLNLKNLSLVYEDWCSQMLRHSKQSDRDLIDRFTERFGHLAAKLALDQGFTFSQIQQAQMLADQAGSMSGGTLTQTQRNGTVANDPSLNPNLLGLMSRVKLNIDFTKLAKIAYNLKRGAVSDFLIRYEKQIVKKIPFMLEVEQYMQALLIATESGDPNNINKVLSEILKKKGIEECIKMASSAQDGLRHLRNFAKKRKNEALMREIYEFKLTRTPQEVAQSGLQNGDLTEIGMLVKHAYEEPDFFTRHKKFSAAGESARSTYKDQFYTLMIGGLQEVVRKQSQIYKSSGVTTPEPEVEELMDGSLSSLISYLAVQNTPKTNNELKTMKKDLKIDEQLYFTVAIKGWADAKMWHDVEEMIKTKKSPVPFSTVGELCNDVKNMELAQRAFRRVPDQSTRIELLMEFGFWKAAVEEIFATKKQHDYLDEVAARGPSFVHDWIKQEQDKLALK